MSRGACGRRALARGGRGGERRGSGILPVLLPLTPRARNPGASPAARHKSYKTSEGRAEFLRAWRPGFEQEGTGVGGMVSLEKKRFALMEHFRCFIAVVAAWPMTPLNAFVAGNPFFS